MTVRQMKDGEILATVEGMVEVEGEEELSADARRKIEDGVADSFRSLQRKLRTGVTPRGF